MYLLALAVPAGLGGVSPLRVRLLPARPILGPPGARKANLHPTPKGGGLGSVAAFVLGMLVLYQVAVFARMAEPRFTGV